MADDALCLRFTATALAESVGCGVGGRLESPVQSGNCKTEGKKLRVL